MEKKIFENKHSDGGLVILLYSDCKPLPEPAQVKSSRIFDSRDADLE